jgi:hypothetical protein
MKRNWWIAGSILVFLVGAFFYFRWSSRIVQPLEFSHRQHVLQNIACSRCHQVSDTLPQVTTCAPCHPDLTSSKSVSWQKVYRVTPDIIFSHQQHTEFSCATCHRQMTSAKRWIHESRFSMDFCMDCHAQKAARNECGTCHKNR